MSADERTTCTQCGASILIGTWYRTGGLCMPCENRRLADEQRKVPAGTLVMLSYWPGMSRDQTSWETFLSDQGILSQEILRDRRGERQRTGVTEIKVQSMTPEALCEVKRLMGDLLRIVELKEIERNLNTVDDWPLGILAFPGSGFSMRLPLNYYSLGSSVPQRHLSLREAEAVKGFEALWDLIDRYSPLRVPQLRARHRKGHFPGCRKSLPP